MSERPAILEDWNVSLGRLARVARVLPLGLCLMAGSAALADEAKPDAQGAKAQQGLNGYASLGAAVVPDYEGSQDYMPAPVFAGKLGYEEYYVELRGPKLRANVMPKVLPFGFEFGPSLAYRFGRDDVENRRVDRLRDIDGSVALGGFAKVSVNGLLQPSDELAFDVEGLAGVGKERDGATVSFGPSYSFSPFERWRFGVKASATWADDRYTATYFGIDADNAVRSGLAAYDAKGGIKDVGLALNASYMWTENWGITGVLGVTRLIGDAADSPIVDDEGSATQGIATLGVVYSF
jgi:outer membrane scaffolding protein for murein synthesis (MipA/OmpV family)